MLNNISDLEVWYPFLPLENQDALYNAVCRYIKDIRVSVPLKVHVDYTDIESISVRLTGITNVMASSMQFDAPMYLKISVTTNTDNMNSDMDIPCYSSSDQIPSGCNSYAIADITKLSVADGIDIPVHPDCLDIDVYREGSDMLPVLFKLEDGSFVKALKLKDGYNTSVSFRDGTIIIRVHGDAGKGLSEFALDKVNHLQELLKKEPIGLRSINGFRGTIPFKAGKGVTITASELNGEYSIEGADPSNVEGIVISITGEDCLSSSSI